MLISFLRESLEPQPRIKSESVDIEKTIADIEWLERLYSLPDGRPLQLADREAANQEHDRNCADNPWFRLWKRYGLPR
ncbi:MAG: hypothetical protein ACE14M_06540 [Terriglobales bacterium]